MSGLPTSHLETVCITVFAVVSLVSNYRVACRLKERYSYLPNCTLITFKISLILVILCPLLLILNEWKVVNLRGTLLCGTVAVFQELTITLLPITNWTIFFQLLTASRHLLPLVLGWGVTMCVSLPAFWTRSYAVDTKTCKTTSEGWELSSWVAYYCLTILQTCMLTFIPWVFYVRALQKVHIRPSFVWRLLFQRIDPRMRIKTRRIMCISGYLILFPCIFLFLGGIILYEHGANYPAIPQGKGVGWVLILGKLSYAVFIGLQPQLLLYGLGDLSSVEGYFLQGVEAQTQTNNADLIFMQRMLEPSTSGLTGELIELHEFGRAFAKCKPKKVDELGINPFQ